ncbi:unnamed protein product [Callosobruchus maculatus]|uniref:Uncharacterized protein n=1 Tax=Callosobruchus maculatus TaxID=64391 RepID=A0A653DF51_CALMS|nr:unnamed protein product [Callosobruchus maculatus]
MHHPKAAMERLYLPRKEGGRGLLDIRNLCNKQVAALKRYFSEKAQESPLHNAILKSDLSYTPLNLSQPDVIPAIITNDTDVPLLSYKEVELQPLDCSSLIYMMI